MQRGEVPQPATLAELISYVAFQERATQIAHRNTAARLPKDDKMGRLVLGTVAGDDTLLVISAEGSGAAVAASITDLAGM